MKIPNKLLIIKGIVYNICSCLYSDNLLHIYNQPHKWLIFWNICYYIKQTFRIIVIIILISLLSFLIWAIVSFESLKFFISN